ncbi:MAG: hypothetical protein V4516_00215 [Pseudomonadota bacterium]
MMTNDHPKRPVRTSRPKLWRALVMAGLTSGIATGLADAQSAGTEPAEGLWLAQSAVGEGGEGGEAGAGQSGDAVVDLLVGLGQAEGHLRSGMQIYAGGGMEMAATHMGHPKAELYAAIGAALDAAGVAGFGTELDAVTAALAAGKPVAEIEAAYTAALERIDAARSALGASPKTRLMAMALMLRAAGGEYDVGVKDGAIVKLAEYQDAWGFVETAKAEAGRLAEDRDPAVAGAATTVRATLDGLAPAFPALMPTGPISGDAQMVMAAAATTELAAYALK